MPPNTTECRAHTVGDSLSFVRGFQGQWWQVSETTYTLPLGVGPPTCPAGFAKPLATTGRLSVAGKGEIAFALSEGARCMDSEEAWKEPQEFTITGGTGPFAAASGTGKLEQRWFNWARVPDVGGETWTGTLEV